MGKILVPIDFSQSSLRILQYAREFARDSGMQLNLLHCYSQHEYNRPYNFGNREYSHGIKEMLEDFYKKHIEEPDKGTRFLAIESSFSDGIISVSNNFELVVLESKDFDSNLQRWMNSNTSYIGSLAQCPVLIKPPLATYTPWKKIWHIQRNENEYSIIKKFLGKLKIAPSLVEAKSFKQTTFKSALWKSIVAYIKSPKEELLSTVLNAKRDEENIDLIILISHDTNIFRKFINDDAMQIIFRFNIPVMIFQDNKTQ